MSAGGLLLVLLLGPWAAHSQPAEGLGVSGLALAGASQQLFPGMASMGSEVMRNSSG